MPNPFEIPEFRANDPISAAKFNLLSAALRQQSLQPGQFQSGAYNVQRPFRGSSSSSTAVAELFGLLILDVPGAEYTYSAIRSYCTHGSVDEGVIPFVKTVDAYGASQFQAELLNEDSSEEEQKKMFVVNPWWPEVIKAGTTFNEGKPVVVRGYVDPEWKTDLGGTSTIDTIEAFIITNVCYPLTIIQGLTTSAVTIGSPDFEIDNISLLWGREPRDNPGSPSETIEVTNRALASDNNAGCIAMQVVDGSWLVLDLECPAEV